MYYNNLNTEEKLLQDMLEYKQSQGKKEKAFAIAKRLIDVKDSLAAKAKEDSTRNMAHPTFCVI